MDINRHNYETFFLLYIDGELRNSERLEVEAFVQQNPDLSGELSQLQSMVVVPDNNALGDKSFLFKNELLVNSDNYEDYFLLAVDKELSTVETEALQMFLLANPTVQPQLDILRRTIVQPETIVFEEKSVLYRSEAQVRKFGVYPWFRIAVAAAIIAIVASIWITKVANVEIETLVAVTNDSNSKSFDNTTASKSKSEVDSNASNQQEKIVLAKKNQRAIIPQSQSINKTIQKHNVSTVNDNANSLPKPENNPYVANHKIPEDLRDDMAIALRNLEDKSITTVVNDKLVSTAVLSKNTVYKEVEGQDQETIFIAGAEINKNKLKGLFKKATTLLEKRFKKNDGNNIVEIASFKINTN